jgi:hypothetical protein
MGSFSSFMVSAAVHVWLQVHTCFMYEDSTTEGDEIMLN